ncbi:MAG: DUF2891 domain-containing protein [Acidobacteria bacterium]|nr:DUF2891 domain-containing protein [Acidobacteriota bacterium]
MVLMMASGLDPAAAGRFANLALACVHREYPNKIAHTMSTDADARPPRQLTPAFYGCFDWHSSVHGHWLLARLVRLYPDAAFAPRAGAALARSITPGNIQAEVAYLQAEGRATFERPYGLAWLLLLGLELRESKSSLAPVLAPLEAAAVARLSAWSPKLSHPVRSGEHSQTAFALGLMLDYARGTGDTAFARLLEERACTFYSADRACPASYEPSGEDFLSPCLAEADVMRRVLAPAEFARWFEAFLPSLPYKPQVVTDPTDGKLAHLDGLNLSRAWMLEGIAAALPAGHRSRASLDRLGREHREAGLRSVTGTHYEGGHWLGSFAVYLTSARGQQ